VRQAAVLPGPLPVPPPDGSPSGGNAAPRRDADDHDAFFARLGQGEHALDGSMTTPRPGLERAWLHALGALRSEARHHDGIFAELDGDEHWGELLGYRGPRPALT
jgi:hypothetical protein